MQNISVRGARFASGEIKTLRIASPGEGMLPFSLSAAAGQYGGMLSRKRQDRPRR
ncbi:hypothetical protein [Burkholderia glumae]|uniref:Uncharacterized protein n=1 Tax=Burkholderia glumae TaxID=337 RepID=A0AAQ0BRU9_BURGL|nr:hypothetical protein [Burkholderia glumae]MCM2484599.1 hypothetical protein [Burkholderia glumae]MCM2494979.1 hypothetical protein [Burkholderia glumae]MCM2510292.1 hypothetical protein [Burkholderia glumae]MCM2540056.1 hypothetical protein [Burkholderia glumae]MCM2545844.1 hypothetical protein [Burkholderia glumae]